MTDEKLVSFTLKRVYHLTITEGLTDLSNCETPKSGETLNYCTRIPLLDGGVKGDELL